MSFDALAPCYRWMEFILSGQKLQHCRLRFLDQVLAARNVLILGEGPGRFLVECRRRLPKALITCVDSSEQMLAVARSQLRRAGLSEQRVRFVNADLLAWEPPEAMADLVVTHFVLDCFRPDQLTRIVPALARATRPEAHWIFADFNIPASGWARLRARWIIKVMYLFFRAVTRLPASRLTAPDDLFRGQGFELIARSESEWGLLCSELWRKPSQILFR